MKKANVNVNEAFIDYIMNVNASKINQAVRKYITSPEFEKKCVEKVTNELATELNVEAVDVSHIDTIIASTLSHVNVILRFEEASKKDKKKEDTYQTAKEAVLKYLKYNNNFADKDTIVSICGSIDAVKELENSGIITEIPEEGGYIAGEGYNE